MLGVTSTDAAAGNSILLGPGGAPAAAAGGKGPLAWPVPEVLVASLVEQELVAFLASASLV